nr:hypothetical protein [Tanacetum cinerariifolium]
PLGPCALVAGRRHGTGVWGADPVHDVYPAGAQHRSDDCCMAASCGSGGSGSGERRRRRGGRGYRGSIGCPVLGLGLVVDAVGAVDHRTLCQGRH